MIMFIMMINVLIHVIISIFLTPINIYNLVYYLDIYGKNTVILLFNLYIYIVKN